MALCQQVYCSKCGEEYLAVVSLDVPPVVESICPKCKRLQEDQKRVVKVLMEYIKKDITTVTMGVIAHGCNCQGVMGSGVAKAIRDKWPGAYEAYKRMPIGRTMLGTAQVVNVDDQDQLFIANCFTQIFYGKNGRFADPTAIERSLNHAYEWADLYCLPIYMPKIGAGLGGLDWETEVAPIVERVNNQWPRVETFVCLWNE